MAVNTVAKLPNSTNVQVVCSVQYRKSFWHSQLTLYSEVSVRVCLSVLTDACNSVQKK